VTVSETEPTVHEVEASEVPDAVSVPVQVQGPIRVQPLPATSWSAHHFELSATQATKIAQADPRRSRAIITVATQAAWIGPSQQQAANGLGYRQGAAATSTLELRHNNEIWAIADTAGALLSIIEEYWTD